MNFKETKTIMIKISISSIVLVFILSFSNILDVLAQVGIGTSTVNDNETCTVLGNTVDTGAKIVSILNSSNIEMFTLLDNGKAGLVNEQPITTLDLRGFATNQFLGIGMSNASASEVKAGAIRYVATARELHYSDGTEWINLESSIKRPYLVASNNYVAGSYPSNKITRVTGFVASHDSYASFNASTSVYTAPKDGMYSVSFTISFNRVLSISANSYILATWSTNTGNSIKNIQAFPIGGTGQVGITCAGTIYLSAGEEIYPEIWHNLGGTKSFRVYGISDNPNSDMGFNQISIFAQ